MTEVVLFPCFESSQVVLTLKLKSKRKNQMKVSCKKLLVRQDTNSPLLDNICVTLLALFPIKETHFDFQNW